MIDLPAGQSQTPTTLATGGIGFRGLSTGTTTVSATGGALQPCDNLAFNCGSVRLGILPVNVN
jgi:hypothetical protein